MRARILFAFIAMLFAIATPEGARAEEFVPVCERSHYMRKAIEIELGKSCESIGLSDLSRISELGFRFPEGYWGWDRDPIGDRDFNGLQDITGIKLSHVSLLNVSVATLQKLTNLRHLEISEALVGPFSREMFRGFAELQKLILMSIEIRHLPEDIFQDLIALEWLYIDQIPIQDVSPGLFSSLRRLKRLILRGTELKSLPDSLFDLNTEIARLDLSQNALLNDLRPRIFAELNELRDLSIGLTNTPSFSFSWLPRPERIKEIDIAQIGLSEVPPHFFDAAPSIQFLRMEGNKFDRLPPRIFDRLPNLRKVSMGSESLNTVPDHVFSNNGRLHAVTVFTSPLKGTTKAAFKGIRFVAGLPPEFGADPASEEWRRE